MSYRQAFFGAPPDQPIAAVLALARGAMRDHRPDIRAKELFVRVLDDAQARAAGVRWWWLAAPADHGRVFTLDAVSEGLGAPHVCIVHDDSRGVYRFASSFEPGFALVSHGALLGGDRHLLTIEHPQAGRTNAALAADTEAAFPNAVVLGLRQAFPGADTAPRAYLQLLDAGPAWRVFDRARGALDDAERVEAPPPLAGFLDAWLETRTLPTEADELLDASERARRDARWKLASERLDAARAALDEGDLASAERRCRELLELEPREWGGWEVSTRLALRRDDLEGASRSARRAAELVLSWRPTASQLGHYAIPPVTWVVDALGAAGRWDEANELLAWARTWAPDHPGFQPRRSPWDEVRAAVAEKRGTPVVARALRAAAARDPTRPLRAIVDDPALAYHWRSLLRGAAEAAADAFPAATQPRERARIASELLAIAADRVAREEFLAFELFEAALVVDPQLRPKAIASDPRFSKVAKHPAAAIVFARFKR